MTSIRSVIASRKAKGNMMGEIIIGLVMDYGIAFIIGYMFGIALAGYTAWNFFRPRFKTDDAN